MNSRLGTTKKDIKKIAVIGAGVMGCGVSLDLAIHGYKVVLCDLTDTILAKAELNIKKDLKLIKMINHERCSFSQEAVLENISLTVKDEVILDVDMVIENVTEDFEVKKKVYVELVEKGLQGCIFAVNTSCISITRIAGLLPDAGKVVGMHFMNPVPLSKIVELIRGHHTSDRVIEVSKDFIKSIQKTAVVVNDSPGFVANRLSHLFMNEAAFLIQEQVASPGQVDLMFKQGYGHKMGPLETADLIGLDTVVHSLDILYDSFQDPKFRCAPLLRKMVHAGLLGKKTGRGFYQYGE